MSAKYYIYRNLHTKGFSMRYKGKVIQRPFCFRAYNVSFKVNEKGRQRVIKERQKNVHTFIVLNIAPEILQYGATPDYYTLPELEITGLNIKVRRRKH